MHPLLRMMIPSQSESERLMPSAFLVSSYTFSSKMTGSHSFPNIALTTLSADPVSGWETNLHCGSVNHMMRVWV